MYYRYFVHFLSDIPFTYYLVVCPLWVVCERRVKCRVGSCVVDLSSASSISSLLRRSSRPRQFYADFTSTSAVDESSEEWRTRSPKKIVCDTWYMSHHMVGTHRSRRQQFTDEIKPVTNLAVELLGELSFSKLTPTWPRILGVRLPSGRHHDVVNLLCNRPI